MKQKKEVKTEEALKKEALDAWLKSSSISDSDITEWKEKHKGSKLVTIYPYDEEDLQDAVRFFVRPLLRKEVELITQKSISGQDVNIRVANKMTLNYCILGGDEDRLDEAPVYSGLLQEIGKMNQAKSTERKNY